MVDNPYAKYTSQNPYAKYSNPEKGFFDRVTDAAAKRGMQLQNIDSAQALGEQTRPETVLQKTGNAAALLNDIAVEGFKSVGNGLSSITPDAIEQPIREAVGNGITRLGNTYIGNTVRGAADEVSQAYSQFAQNNPRAARNVEATANLGMVAPIGRAIKGAAVAGTPLAVQGAQALGKTSKAVALSPINEAKTLVKGAMARDVEGLELASQAIKDRSTAAYQRMRSVGARFTPQTSKQISQDVLGALQGSGVLNKHLHGKIIGITDDFANEMASGAVDLESLDQWRRLYADVAGNHLDPDSARKASIIVDAIDDSVDRLTPANLANGSPDAVDALKTGRSEWHRYKKFQMISDIVRKSDGDANYLKRELKKLSDNPRKVRGFTVDEVRALKDASRLSGSEGLYKMLGKFGIDLGNSRIGNTALPVIGGIAAGVGAGAGTGFALPAVGTAARQAQKYKARAKTETLLREIEK